MGRKKGGTNKSWSAQEKYEIIKPIIEGKKSSHDVTRETRLSNGRICNWIKKARESTSKVSST